MLSNSQSLRDWLGIFTSVVSAAALITWMTGATVIAQLLGLAAFLTYVSSVGLAYQQRDPWFRSKAIVFPIMGPLVFCKEIAYFLLIPGLIMLVIGGVMAFGLTVFPAISHAGPQAPSAAAEFFAGMCAIGIVMFIFGWLFDCLPEQR
jgi:hypothetical protein